MELINLFDAIEGMVIGKDIISMESSQIILSQGIKLKDNMIKGLMKRGIEEIYVKDLYTVDFNPRDSIQNDMKAFYLFNIDKFAPISRSGALSDEIMHANNTAKELLDYICNNEIYINLCLEMKIVNEKFYYHAITTSVISMLLSILNKLSIEEILIVALSGLFHDIGMLEAKCLITHKSHNNQETFLWNELPMYGYYMALEKKLSSEVANIIKNSREKWNGTGIPEKLEGYNIPLGSRILSVAITYAELIEFENQEPYEAIECLYGARDYYFDPKIVDLFINNISIYPLKAIVRLSNNEVGVIVNVRKNRGPRPVVNVFFNAFNKPLSKPKEIDLGKERTIFIKKILG